MELTGGATGNTINALLIPSTPISRNPINLHFSRPNPYQSYRLFPNSQSKFGPNPRNSCKNPSFIARCSTKPNTDDRGNVIKDQGSTPEPNSDLNIENTQKPTSKNQGISSTNSSFLSRGLVLDLGSDGSWDSVDIGAPVVKRFLSDEEERWYMWYYGRSSRGDSGSIGLAVSSNGIHWERGKGQVQSGGDVGLVLDSSNDWWAFDTNCIMPGEVVIMSSSKIRASNAVYWLYYTGFSNEKFEFLDNSLEFRLENPENWGTFCNEKYDNGGNGSPGQVLKSLPGLAMSQDGRHWARIEGDHHSGALFDVGCEGEWDSMFIASPQVVFHSSGDLRMYYHSFDSEKGQFGIGIARSRDGMRWVKLGKMMGGGRTGSFDECGVMNPYVVRNKKDGNYVMVYEGVGIGGRRSIGLAHSSDGLKDWRRVEDGPVLKWAEEDRCWDDQGVGSPCLVQMEGEEDEWRLYYRGIGKEGRTGIGMAVSGGNDARNFQRWTGFHL